MKLLESATEVVALAAAIWVFFYQFPRARRERDAFAIICSLLTGLAALALWLFVGVGLKSR